MSALLTTIPDAQDIGGLLRLWSPVVILAGERTGFKSAVVWLDPLAIASSDGAEVVDSVGLDLTDPTGRAHAAWWLTGRLDQHPGDEVWQAICRATTGIDMTSAQIDTVARLVLRLAGRTP